MPFQEVVITRRLSRARPSPIFPPTARPAAAAIFTICCAFEDVGADRSVVIGEPHDRRQLLSGLRPDDRRELFEEAAGVGLYRDRRRSCGPRPQAASAPIFRGSTIPRQRSHEPGARARALAQARRRRGEITTRRFRGRADARVAPDSRVEGRTRPARSAPRRRCREATRRVVRAVRARSQARAQMRRTRHAPPPKRVATSAIKSSAMRARRLLTLQGEIAVAEERHRNALTAGRRRAGARAPGRGARAGRRARRRRVCVRERRGRSYPDAALAESRQYGCETGWRRGRRRAVPLPPDVKRSTARTNSCANCATDSAPPRTRARRRGSCRSPDVARPRTTACRRTLAALRVAAARSARLQNRR